MAVVSPEVVEVVEENADLDGLPDVEVEPVVCCSAEVAAAVVLIAHFVFTARAVRVLTVSLRAIIGARLPSSFATRFGSLPSNAP